MVRTLEALAHVAEADVAGGAAALLAEAALPEVRQQQHAPALYALLAERHLQVAAGIASHDGGSR